MTRGIINAYDIEQATGISYAVAVTGRGANGWAYGGHEYHEGDCWSEMVAASGHPKWVRCVGIGSWFPATIVAKAAELGLTRDDNGKPLQWVEGRPCDETITSDTWAFPRCERVAIAVKHEGMPGATHVCKLHLNAHEKSQANQAAWHARWDERRAADARRADHVRLADELMEWAGPLLAELGIHPKTVTTGSIGERAGILLPAEAVATLVEAAIGERYPGPKEPGS